MNNLYQGGIINMFKKTYRISAIITDEGGFKSEVSADYGIWFRNLTKNKYIVPLEQSVRDSYLRQTGERVTSIENLSVKRVG